MLASAVMMKSTANWQHVRRRDRRLLVLASKRQGISPSQRFRLEQWAPHLADDHHIHLDFEPFESPRLTELLYERGHIFKKGCWTLLDYARRAAVLKKARNYDGVVIHREAALIGPAVYERLLAAEGIRIIYDFDDAIWSPGQAWGNGFFSRLHFTSKTSAICKLATAVTTGNDFLADYARERNDAVFVVPTSIDLDRYRVLPEPPDDKPFTVCWTGSNSTLVHFEHAREPLEELAKKLSLIVKVICNKPPDRPIAGAEMEFVPWSAEREATDIGGCHVGIMPLPDDEVSRGKCGLKALQCMAIGRPVVVSPVGANKEIIRHGENGLHASTTAQWVEALSRLAGDKSLRQRLGRNARTTVEQGYSAELSATKFARVIDRVLA